jgi:tetratricopeptide (TPR) repeat protein
VPDELTVVDRDRVWIPIETTATSRGFATAWQEGAARYRDYQARGLVSLWHVQAAQSEYPPSQPRVAPLAAAALDAADVAARTARAGAIVGEWRDTFLASHRGAAAGGGVSAAARIELARVFIDADQLEQARDHLERALDAAPAAAHNGLAVVSARRGDIRDALVHNEAALRADSTDAGLWWNSALLRRAAGDTLGAVRAAHTAIDRAGGPVAACGVAGVAGADTSRALAPPLTPEAARALLERALRDVPLPGAALDSTSGARPPASPQAPRRVGASRGAEGTPQTVSFYWKEAGS